MKNKTIGVDEHGRCEIASINGDEDADAGSFGESLEEGDEVELRDGSTWSVAKVYSYIQTSGSGYSNFVYVDLETGE